MSLKAWEDGNVVFPRLLLLGTEMCLLILKVGVYIFLQKHIYKYITGKWRHFTNNDVEEFYAFIKQPATGGENQSPFANIVPAKCRVYFLESWNGNEGGLPYGE